MGVKTWPDKDPDEVLDYGMNWAPRGLGTDVITVSTASVVTGAVTVDQHTISPITDVPAGQGTITWLRGGTIGETCTILLKAETQSGRKLDQTMNIKITST